MEYIIKGRKPESMFNIFEEISAIPRCSGNEEKIADYIEGYATRRGLYCYRDKLHNVLIRKPASPGREDSPAVLLQAHIDMVCEKNSDTDHDFEKDGLKLLTDGELLFADRTTLGADDGTGVALMLALIDEDAASHPPIEFLFTSQEEIGLVGASAFDYSLITAKRMINLDAHIEGEAIAGCAGGVRTTFSFDYDTLPAPPIKTMTLKVTGLAGGHSGSDINRGRGNANKIMGRILDSLYRIKPFQLVSISGGMKINAIARECEAEITAFDPQKIKDEVLRIEHEIKNELAAKESGLRVFCGKGKNPERVLSFADTRRIIAAAVLAPDGVLAMSGDLPGLVEASANLGVISQIANESSGNTSLTFSARSSKESRLDDICARYELLAKYIGANITHANRYPGWEYSADSRLASDYLTVYQTLFGKQGKATAIHAGLEGGVVRNAISDMDIISIGPDVSAIHTPDEKLNLSSYERFWELVLGMLAL